jgi:hypothetical protein
VRIGDTEVLFQAGSAASALSNEAANPVLIILQGTGNDIENLIGISVGILHRPECGLVPFFLVGIEKRISGSAMYYPG